LNISLKEHNSLINLKVIFYSSYIKSRFLLICKFDEEVNLLNIFDYGIFDYGIFDYDIFSRLFDKKLN